MRCSEIPRRKRLLSRKGLLLLFKRGQNDRKVRWGCLFALFLLISFYSNAGTIKSNDQSEISIPFGTKNKIVYHVASGKYDAYFSKGVQILQADVVVGWVDTAGTVKPLQVSSSMEYSHFTKARVKTTFGQATVYRIYRKGETGLLLEQDFTTFSDKNYFLTRTKVVHSQQPINYSSPLASAKVHLDWGGENYALNCPFDNDMWATYQTKRLDSADIISSEVSVVFNNNRKGFVIGSLEHEVWKSGIQLRTLSDQSFQLTAFGGYTDQKTTHDLLPHGAVQSADGTTVSPLMMVGYFDDWRAGMEMYGSNNKLAEVPLITSWKGSTPVGWNSWGVLQDKIDLGSAKGVINFFADSCKSYRMKNKGLFIDLDSYWDKLVKNGVDGNTDDLKAFVNYCRAKGFEPGIYWAPFVDWGKQADRLVEGSSYTYQETWTVVNGHPLDVDGARAMDPTHPGTRSRIVKYIEFFKSLGFKMIKIDFLGHATLEADHFYDLRVKTGMQAFRSGMEFLDSVLDNKMLVYAAISPNLATSRYVHMRRIACDAYKSISETAYTLNSVTYGWWQGHMYDFIDADHVVFKDASLGENRARLLSAVVTGSLIAGDDYSSPGSWRQVAQKLLQTKELLAVVGQNGKPFRPCLVKAGDATSNFFEKRIGNKLYLCVFNYGEKPSSFKLPYEKLGISKPKISRRVLGASNAKFQFLAKQIVMQVPARDAAFYCLEL